MTPRAEPRHFLNADLNETHAGSPRAAASRSFKLLETLVERFELPTAVPRLGRPTAPSPGALSHLLANPTPRIANSGGCEPPQPPLICIDAEGNLADLLRSIVPLTGEVDNLVHLIDAEITKR